MFGCLATILLLGAPIYIALKDHPLWYLVPAAIAVVVLVLLMRFVDTYNVIRRGGTLRSGTIIAAGIIVWNVAIFGALMLALYGLARLAIYVLG